MAEFDRPFNVANMKASAVAMNPKYAQLAAANTSGVNFGAAPQPGAGQNIQTPPPTLAAAAQQQPIKPQPTGIPQPAGAPAPVQPQRPAPMYRPQPQQFAQPPMNAVNAMPQQPQMPQQSMTQQAGRGNAQGVQNYMTALRAVGAGSGNQAMNSGQLGQQAQAGFRGFGYNGMPTQLGGQFVGPQNMQQGIGYQQNQAQQMQNYRLANTAMQGAYGQAPPPQLENTGGISTVNGPGLANGAGYGAPQWQTPRPWGNPQNAPPDTIGSLWGSGSKAWENYFNASSPNAEAPGQQNAQGSFYSGQAPGAPRYDENWQPIPGSEAVSDIAAKTNIEYAENELSEFLNALGAYSYEYKDEAHGDKRYISPMAQDLERSQLGKHAVFTDPESGYKMVDYGQFDKGRLKGVELAALAMINKKVNDLKKDFSSAMKKELSSKRKK